MTDKPLRILHYVPAVTLAQGGVVRMILDLCTVLAERGHHMSLAVYTNQDVPVEWLNNAPGKPRGIVLPTPLPPLKLLGRTAMRMMDEELSQADVLHLHGPWLDGNRQIANLARRKAVPCIVTLHGMLDDWTMSRRGIKKRIYMALAGRRMLNGAAKIHCTAAGELAQAKKWFDNPRTVVLPCMVDLSPFEHLPGPAAAMEFLRPEIRDLPKLLFLSRLHEQKGVDILIRAVGLLKERSIPFVLLLAGTGTSAYQQFLSDLVRQLNLADRVIFLGHLNGPVKLSMFQAADLFVLPTRHENFGLAIIEAMAAGTPVVTTRGTDIWPEIQAAGGIISDSDPASLADQIIRQLNDPAGRTARAHRGRDWVFQTLATGSLGSRYENLYGSVGK